MKTLKTLSMLSFAAALVMVMNQVFAARNKPRVITGKSEMIVDGKILETGNNPLQSATTISGDGQTKTVSVENEGDVTLKGDNNVITIKGKVDNLRIIGKGNRVITESLQSVTIAGDDNTVSYQSSRGQNGKPAERIVGKNNRVG